jgi:hypothetical protein
MAKDCLLRIELKASEKKMSLAVVGLAVGTEVTLSRFRDDVKEWTTEGKYFETNKDSLQSIMNELISASCIDPGKQGGHRRPGNGYLVQWYVIVSTPMRKPELPTKKTTSVIPNTVDLLWGSKAWFPNGRNGRKD